MNWLEISMTVNGELAEAVADVLARFAPNGVTTEQGVSYHTEADEGMPSGPITVRAYLPADEKLEETRNKVEEALHYLGMIQALPAPRFNQLADQDWMEAWKERYLPIPIGKRLIIVPAWLESPDTSRVELRIDPGMAFGTGTHPTTQTCLEFIEEVFEVERQTKEGLTVIDVGCGSGILSIAALKLGATLALGMDIDELAVLASHENGQVNGIPEESFVVGKGSVEEVRTGAFPLRTARLVLANILAPVLVCLFDGGLADLVEEGGIIILSGILQEQADGVVQAAQEKKLVMKERKQVGDWVTLAMEKRR